MRKVILGRLVSKGQLCDKLKHLDGFPNYVAPNWDSIEECLNDFVQDLGERVELSVEITDALEERDRDIIYSILNAVKNAFPSRFEFLIERRDS